MSVVTKESNPELYNALFPEDEIKEILYFLKDKNDYIEEYGYEYKRISLEDTKILLDYITNLQKENEELKMTNLALADDITKNKIIKQEVLTECCGIPIGEIPMLKIQNDEYKQRIDEATKELEKQTLEDLKTDLKDINTYTTT